MKNFFAKLKHFRWYKELRMFWVATFNRRKPFFYLYARFFLGLRFFRLPVSFAEKKFDSGFSVHYLCSHDDVKLLFWSLASWYLNVSRSGRVYIHEDGSFKKNDRDFIKTRFPKVEIVDHSEARERLEIWLRDYPEASRFRRDDGRYVFAIKFIDPYFVSEAKKMLILDTDVLFYKTPEEIFSALDKEYSVFMQGKLPMEYRFADGQPLPDHLLFLNSGIVGFSKKNFHLEKLEDFCRKNGQNNPSRVVEQAGFAWVLDAAARVVLLPQDKYPLKGDFNAETVARHYTGLRRELFWLEGVRLLVKKINDFFKEQRNRGK